MISMNQVWDESIAFIRKEAGLLVPLALATLYVGDVVTTLAQGFATPAKPNVAATLAVLIGTIWSILGQLSIISLVLKPGRSVGEAMAHGSTRLPKVLLVAITLGLVVALALTPVGVIAVANGANPAVPETLQRLPAWLGLVVLAVLGGLIWLGIRLSLLNALIVERNPGVFSALKAGFGLTQGIAARLALVIILYALVLLVLGSAVKFVAGSIFSLIGSALGSEFAGAVMTALVAGAVNAGLAMIATVFLAVLYCRVRDPNLA